jgi:hypothetical protein
MTKNFKPTIDAYSELQLAYDFFNAQLFKGELPDCVMTYTRQPRTMGYFIAKQWKKGEEDNRFDEIAMNPTYIATDGLQETLQTLVHEMVHLWQFHFGENKPSRGYHNKEFATKMKEVGLQPFDISAPVKIDDNGNKLYKETGYKVSDIAIDNSPFTAAVENFVSSGKAIKWADAYKQKITIENQNDTSPVGNGEESGDVKPSSLKKWKYSCPECGLNVWGKPDIKINCGEHKIEMISQDLIDWYADHGIDPNKNDTNGN